MKNKKNKFKSLCCKADIKFTNPSPDFAGDKSKSMTIGTCYCVCSECGQPCNIYVPIRKKWNINPSERIVPNKKKNDWDKLSKKEIENFRKGEDF
jgi:hypothetical protein